MARTSRRPPPDYEARFARVCQGLQENLPDMEEPDLHFDENYFPINDERAQRIGQALHGNTVVTRLRVHVKAMTLGGTAEIAQFIVESPKLEEIYLTVGHVDRNERTAVVDRFLEAAAINGKIRKLEVPELFGALPFANCLRGNRNTLVCLRLELVGIQDAVITQEMLDEAEAVAAAIGSLPLLEDLKLCENNTPYLVVPILTHLVDHPSLQELHLNQFGSNSTAVVAPSIRNLLQSSMPLQVFDYDTMIKQSVYDTTTIDRAPILKGFDAVFAGLLGHTTLRKLRLVCHEKDEADASVPLIVDLLHNNESLKKLSFSCCDLLGFSKIIEALGTNTTLEKLKVHIWNVIDGFEEESRRLATLLPLVKSLQTLTLSCSMASDDTLSLDFLLGFERNSSLTDICVQEFCHNEEAKDTLEYYANRNKFAPLVANASKAEMSTILAAAYEHEHGLAVAFGAFRERVDIFEESLG